MMTILEDRPVPELPATHTSGGFTVGATEYVTKPIDSVATGNATCQYARDHADFGGRGRRGDSTSTCARS